MAGWMFEEGISKAIPNIQAGIGMGIAGINKSVEGIDGGIAGMQAAIKGDGKGQEPTLAAIAEMNEQKGLMQQAASLMQEMQSKIPQLFNIMEADYIEQIDNNSEQIEQTFQATLNKGFRNMYICVAAFNLCGLILLIFYKGDKIQK